jgi:hypothetical protein
MRPADNLTAPQAIETIRQLLMLSGSRGPKVGDNDWLLNEIAKHVARFTPLAELEARKAALRSAATTAPPAEPITDDNPDIREIAFDFVGDLGLPEHRTKEWLGPRTERLVKRIVTVVNKYRQTTVGAGDSIAGARLRELMAKWDGMRKMFMTSMDTQRSRLSEEGIERDRARGKLCAEFLEDLAALAIPETTTQVGTEGRLREALAPFAEFGQYLIDHPRTGLSDDLYGWDNAVFLRKSDLLRARAALLGDPRD